MKHKKLTYGVGINDADYVVMKHETIGYVDGKQKRKKVWGVLTIKLGWICLSVVTPTNSKRSILLTKVAPFQRGG